jgi:hypothetical protein
MKSRSTVAVATLALGILGASSVSATVLFDLEPSNNTSDRPAGWGPGQSVVAQQNVTINGFSLYFDTPNGANVDFMVYDVTTSTFVYSSIEHIVASDTESWQSSGTFNLTLQSGDVYNFGAIADNSMDIGYIHPRYAYTSNFLEAISTGNANYTSFTSPSYSCCAHAEIALKIRSPSNSNIPEPATWAIMIAGLFGVGAARRLARREAVAA